MSKSFRDAFDVVVDGLHSGLFWVVLFIAGCVVALGWALDADYDAKNIARQNFMRACVVDRGPAKEYECTALWRSGESSTSSAVPVIVPVLVPR